MPTRDQMDAVQDRIEDLTGCRFQTRGEFLRPVSGDLPTAGAAWTDLSFEDRREAIYVNMDWTGFTLEEQMEVIDRAAKEYPGEQWMEGIQASDQRQHDRALFLEQEEERQVASTGRSDLKANLAGEIRVVGATANGREDGQSELSRILSGSPSAAADEREPQKVVERER